MVRGAGAAELVERDVPEPGDSQVVIAVKACSICGGDLHIYKGKHPSAPLPMAFGHELAGVVDQPSARRWPCGSRRPGDRRAGDRLRPMRPACGENTDIAII